MASRPALPPSLVPAAIEASQAARDDGFEHAGFKLLVDQLGVDDRLRVLRWILAQATDRVADEVHAEATAELVEGVLAETGDDSIRATALALGRAMSHVPAAGVPAVLGRLSEVDLDTAMMLWRENRWPYPARRRYEGDRTECFARSQHGRIGRR